MENFWTILGDSFTPLFNALSILGNIPNYTFIIIGMLFFSYWMVRINQQKNDDII